MRFHKSLVIERNETSLILADRFAQDIHFIGAGGIYKVVFLPTGDTGVVYIGKINKADRGPLVFLVGVFRCGRHHIESDFFDNRFQFGGKLRIDRRQRLEILQGGNMLGFNDEGISVLREQASRKNRNGHCCDSGFHQLHDSSSLISLLYVGFLNDAGINPAVVQSSCPTCSSFI